MENAPKYRGTGLSTLTNLGMTCYMNSVLQCLNATLPLTKYFLDQEYKKDVPFFLRQDKDDDNIRKFLALYYKLILNMWEEDAVIQPVSFRTIMQICNQEFRGFRQNDAHECLVFILEMLHQALSMEVDVNISGNVVNQKDERTLTSFKQWKSFLKHFKYSPITRLFYGQYELMTQCNGCQSKFYKYDAFCDLQLSIDTNDKNLSIYDCIAKFMEPEQLHGDNQYKCNKCDSKQDASKQTGFWLLPEILIVHFKRFDYNGNKITKRIEFPINNLNLSRFKVTANPDTQEMEFYDLYAVISHTGSLNSGHYVANILLDSQNKWVCFNDDKVDYLNNITELVNENAYILFYKKKIVSTI